MLRTRFTDLVGCRLPIQQAPMGGVSSPELARAVADAGGLGSITSLGLTNDELTARLDGLVAGMHGTLAVNFLTRDIDPAAVEIAARRVRVVDFFWCDPDPALVEVAHAGGALVNWQVGSVEEAIAAVEAGADLVTAQGIEAGAHVRGEVPLLPLLASIIEAVPVPVMAAGAIADPRALAAVLAAGAAGARIGTRYIATHESGAHPEYVAAIVAAESGSTEISGAFANCPLCASSPRARVLRSAVAAVEALDGHVVGMMTTGDGELPLPKRFGLPPLRNVSGRIDAMPLYAGEGVMLIRSVEPAGALTQRLADDAEQLLRAWPAIVTGGVRG